jgi:hypothetical protein
MSVINNLEAGKFDVNNINEAGRNTVLLGTDYKRYLAITTVICCVASYIVLILSIYFLV